MNMKRSFLCVMLMTLLMTALTVSYISIGIQTVSGASTVSFGYTTFNHEDDNATVKNMTTTYETWTIKITNELTYNTTMKATASLRLTSNTTVSPPTFPYPFLDIHLKYGGTATVFYGGSSEDSYEICPDAEWKSTEDLYISLDSDGYLNLGNNTDRDLYIDDYPLGTLNIKTIWGFGSDINETAGEKVADSGYLGLEFTTFSEPLSESLTTIVIPILNISMLGIALGLIKKYK